MYDTAIAEHMKPTQLVTFVGILANEPLVYFLSCALPMLTNTR